MERGGPPEDRHDPLPIIDDFGTGARWFQRLLFVVDDSNRVKLEHNIDGEVYIRWAIMNSDKRTVAPAIDGNVALIPVGRRSVCLDYHRDSYPALEIYQYRAGQPPTDLLYEDAAGGAIGGKAPAPFTDRSGTTCITENELAPGPFGEPFPTGPIV